MASPPSSCTGLSLLASTSTRPSGNSRLIETDSKPRLASSVFSACWLMRGIDLPFGGRISVEHDTSAERLFSMVSKPAVDSDPAQHQLPAFASQLVAMSFVCQRCRGAYGFRPWFVGFRDLEPPASQQILEEGLGGLILARRGRRSDGKRRTGNLEALRLGGGIDHDGRDPEPILRDR